MNPAARAILYSIFGISVIMNSNVCAFWKGKPMSDEFNENIENQTAAGQDGVVAGFTAAEEQIETRFLIEQEEAEARAAAEKAAAQAAEAAEAAVEEPAAEASEVVEAAAEEISAAAETVEAAVETETAVGAEMAEAVVEEVTAEAEEISAAAETVEAAVETETAVEEAAAATAAEEAAEASAAAAAETVNVIEEPEAEVQKVAPMQAAPRLKTKKTTIGGQALIEGIMMVGPRRTSIAVRKADGSIYVEEMKKSTSETFFEKVPFVRGCIRFFRQLVTGTAAMMKSAEISEQGAPVEGEKNEAEKTGAGAVQAAADTAKVVSADGVETMKVVSEDGIEAAKVVSAEGADETPTVIANAENAADQVAAQTAENAEAGIQAAAENAVVLGETVKDAGASAAKTGKSSKQSESKIDKFVDKHNDGVMVFAAILGLGFSIVLFILLPRLVVDGILGLFAAERSDSVKLNVALNFVEGFLRIAIFLTYLMLTSRIKDVARVWMYHGAEHKTIACYEAGEMLTVENVKKYSRFHPRCGTAFLFIVVLISILVFCVASVFIGVNVWWINLLIRLALVPLIGGISFEILRFTGRHDKNPVCKVFIAPGLWLQRFTTREPNDSMIEVAIAAMSAVIPENTKEDIW